MNMIHIVIVSHFRVKKWPKAVELHDWDHGISCATLALLIWNLNMEILVYIIISSF